MLNSSSTSKLNCNQKFLKWRKGELLKQVGTRKTLMAVMSTKRPAEETLTSLRTTRIKLASPSPERSSGSDTESIHSCQGYKTELANDTSDTSSPSIPHVPNAEYEIVDLEHPKFKFYCSDDSSENEEDVVDGVLNPISSDSLDKAFFGDTSEENSTSPSSNSDVDPGLPRSDYLDFENCLLCHTDKKKISYPYCSTCFTWKKNLFPSRPKRKKSHGRSETLSRSTGVTDLPNNENENENNSLNIKINNGSLSDGTFEDSGVGSSEPLLSQDTVDGPLRPSTSSCAQDAVSGPSNLKNSEACRVCFVKPEDGLFVHQKSAHRYGCYSCAKEIWYSNGGCPICRRKVFKVTKLYI